MNTTVYLCVCSGNAVCNSGWRCCSFWAESVWSHSSHHQHRTVAEQTEGTQTHRHANVSVLICDLTNFFSFFFSERFECSLRFAAYYLCRQWWSMSGWLPTVSHHSKHGRSNWTWGKARELWATCKTITYATKLNCSTSWYTQSLFVSLS